MPQSTKYILPIYGAFAIYALGYFSLQNAYIDIVLEERQAWLTSIPTNPKIRPRMTDITSLDESLATMFIFYWPVLDGSFPGLSLKFFNLSGTLTLSLVLFSLESLRKGNRGSFSFVFNSTLWGMISVMATLAISIPWYLFIHLLISTTASRPTSANLSIPIHELRALVFKIVFGLILPCAMVALPETTTQMLFTRQTGIALWQLWPFWSAAVHYSAKKLLPVTEEGLDPEFLWEKTRTAFRSVYGLTFAIAAISHIATWAVCLTATYAVPQLLDGRTIPALHPAAVFLTTSPWSSIKTESVGEGSLWLIQWDQILGAGAIYWWSFDLYRAAHTTQGKRIDWLAFALKTTAVCLFSGFTGAAVELLWEREEMILEAGRPKEKGK